MMKVNVTISGNTAIIEVQGRIDTITASEFEASLLPLTEKHALLVVDCSQLDYISSSGLRVFLMAQKKLNATAGKLRLCCLQPTIREIFDISGFSSIFAIFPDQQSATL